MAGTEEKVGGSSKPSHLRAVLVMMIDWEADMALVWSRLAHVWLHKGRVTKEEQERSVTR